MRPPLRNRTSGTGPGQEIFSPDHELPVLAALSSRRHSGSKNSHLWQVSRIPRGIATSRNKFWRFFWRLMATNTPILEMGVFAKFPILWRRGSESNRRTRLCRGFRHSIIKAYTVCHSALSQKWSVDGLRGRLFPKYFSLCPDRVRPGARIALRAQSSRILLLRGAPSRATRIAWHPLAPSNVLSPNQTTTE